MSNAQHNLAKLVTHVIDKGVRRKIRKTERLILREFADDARDHDECRSKLSLPDLMFLCGCSDRMAQIGIAILQANGHITRESTGQGLRSFTHVHVNEAVIGTRPSVATKYCRRVTDLPDVAEPPKYERGDPRNMDGGTPEIWTGGPPKYQRGVLSKKEDTHTHAPSARAREAGRNLDEVEAVFGAWDAMCERVQQPGPVERSVSRSAAVRLKLERFGLVRVLFAVETVGASDFLQGKRARPGQGDWRAGFDWVFETGPRFMAMGLFNRILEGEFGRPAPRELPPADLPPKLLHLGEPPEIAELRQALRARLGDARSASWIDQLAMQRDGDSLRVTGSSNFVTDWVSANLSSDITGSARRLWGPETIVTILSPSQSRALVSESTR